MDISGSTLSVHDVPEGLVLHCGRRPWITELVEQAKLRPEAQQDYGGFGIRNPRSRLPMAGQPAAHVWPRNPPRRFKIRRKSLRIRSSAAMPARRANNGFRPLFRTGPMAVAVDPASGPSKSSRNAGTADR